MAELDKEAASLDAQVISASTKLSEIQALMKECAGQPITAVTKPASTRYEALGRRYQKEKEKPGDLCQHEVIGTSGAHEGVERGWRESPGLERRQQE